MSVDWERQKLKADYSRFISHELQGRSGDVGQRIWVTHEEIVEVFLRNYPVYDKLRAALLREFGATSTMGVSPDLWEKKKAAE